jgi:hypothetical protein
LKISKPIFVSFKKFRTKHLGVDNVEIYRCVKSQFKINCILGYIKITNLIKFQVSKMCIVRPTLDLHIFYFRRAENTTNLSIFFSTLVDLIITYSGLFVSVFLKF